MSLSVAVLLSIAYGISYAVITSLYPELEPDNDVEVIQANLTDLADLGNLSAYAHIIEAESDREPPVVVADQDDTTAVPPAAVERSNETHNEAPPSVRLDANATNSSTHGMDIVRVSRVVSPGLNGSNTSTTFVESVLRFDLNATEYLRLHPELLTPPPPAEKSSFSMFLPRNLDMIVGQ